LIYTVKLAALATLAATGAFAQSSVQIDGVMDVGFQSINYKGADNTVNGINGNGSSTSQINFRGTEDLGGGLKANFRVETDWNTTSNMGNAGTGSSVNAGTVASSINSTAGTFGNGEIRVGLAGGFGSIDAGAVNYNTLGTYLTGQPFGTAIGSGFRTMFINDGQAASAVRSENSIKYVSPSFSGLTASLYYSGKQTKATSSTPAPTATNSLNPQANAFGALGAYDQIGTQEIGVNYANGPLAASFSNLKQDSLGVGAPSSSGASTTGADLTVNTLGANYALGAAKVFGLYQTQKTASNSVDRKAFSVSGTYTMGAVVLMAQVGELKADAGTYSGQKSKLVALGADYNLSKRTAVYFRAESIDDKARAMNGAVNPQQIGGAANVAALTDQKFGRTSVGVRHAF
jgi:predicted porin